MRGKRFKIIDKEFISYYGGYGHLISNGNCKFWLWHDESESQKVCDKLNIIMEENEQLKKDRFICLDCKYCGYTEIGCLCEKQDHWEDFKSECNDFKELKYYDGDVE